jgi:hypothetical protein
MRQRIGIWLAVLVVLGAVFMSYFQPDFVFDIANRIVLCL